MLNWGLWYLHLFIVEVGSLWGGCPELARHRLQVLPPEMGAGKGICAPLWREGGLVESTLWNPREKYYHVSDSVASSCLHRKVWESRWELWSALSSSCSCLTLVTVSLPLRAFPCSYSVILSIIHTQIIQITLNQLLTLLTNNGWICWIFHVF